jgi:hypothetical protein
MSEKPTPVAPVQDIVHTPEPWWINDASRYNDELPRVCGQDGVIAIVKDGPVAANARLISAAPFLLAACKRLIQEITDGQTTVYKESGIACELIEAAIKRAS